MVQSVVNVVRGEGEVAEFGARLMLAKYGGLFTCKASLCRHPLELSESITSFSQGAQKYSPNINNGCFPRLYSVSNNS